MNKKKIEKYLVETRMYSGKNIKSICPFTTEKFKFNKDGCLNEYCGKVFPGWRRRVCKGSNGIPCPCYVLSIAYVKRRFREWLKE